MKTTKIMQHLIGKTYEEVSSHLNIKEDGGDCCGWSECGIDDALSFNQSRRFDTPLGILPSAQPAPMAVAYLDLGAGGYMDIGTDLTDEELDAIPKGRHMLGIVGTYGVEGYVPAQPAPSMPDLLESLRCACNYIDKLGGFSKQYRVMLASAPKQEAQPAPPKS